MKPKPFDFKVKGKKANLQYQCQKELVRIEGKVYQKTVTLYMLKRILMELIQVK